jgi:hypothetical protein
LFLAASVALLPGCDRSPPAPAAGSAATPDDTAVARHVQVESLAQALPKRITHLCADGRNTLYWTQETEAANSAGGGDVMFTLADASAPASGVGTVASELPRATALTTFNILAAIQGSGFRVQGSGKQKPGGTIQSICAGPDGEVYFYFVGGVGNVTQACLGRFDPRGGGGGGGPGAESIRILADTRQLAEATGRGASLELARGTLLAQKLGGERASRTSRVLLFLRHTDGRAIFAFEPRRLGSSGGTLDLSLSKPQGFSEVRRADTNEPIDLTREDCDLSAGIGDELLVTDRRLGALYRVDSLGKATLLASLVGLPEGVTTPTVVNDDLFAQASSSRATTAESFKGCALLFAPDGNAIDPPISARPDPAHVRLNPPGLLSFSPAAGTWLAVDQSDLHAPGEITVQALRLTQLVPIGVGSWAGTPNSPVQTRAAFVAYDMSSGLLVRVRLVERR